MGFFYCIHILCCIAVVETNFVAAANEGFKVDYDVIYNSNGKIITAASNSSIIVHASNIKPSVTSVVIGAHSQKFNITLSYDDEPHLHNSVTGKSIGLTVMLDDDDDVSSTELWLFNYNSQNISVFLKVMLYSANDLVPGGCNMEFPIEISPFLRLTDNQFTTCLEFQHANLGSPKHIDPPSCSRIIKHLSYDVYALFLEEHNYSEKEYFKGIQHMSNITALLSQAHKINTHKLHPETRLYFLKYPQTGAVYNIIAKYTADGKEHEAIYVPSATYGCKLYSEGLGCGFPYTSVTKPFLLLFSLIGIFISLFGHKLFTAEIFFFGFLLFLMPCFIIISKFDRPWYEMSTLYISIAVGVVGGLLWVFLWCLWFCPTVAVIPVAASVGFLLASILLYTPLGNEEVFISEKIYWILICFGILLSVTVSISSPRTMSIVGSSVVGAYISVLYLDNYLGSSLIFIVINVLKRAIESQPSFIATNDFPFQSNNIVVIFLWVIFASISIALQMFINRKVDFVAPSCACRKSIRSSVASYQNQATVTQPLLSQATGQQVYDSINDNSETCRY